ncbi:FecR family protein [Pseudozobellia sp. WGM2]|uniref:FecR family protein n=1 Tax=Pseudozobellia sp. WGM2 TaxID=2787625 RepID=UPI001ADF0C21|nr:FecR family protein [Pseudozobellia sp. WGM2]
MITQKAENLIVKFINNQASISELEELEHWMKNPSHERVFKVYVKTNYAIDYDMKRFDTNKVKNKLAEEMAHEKKAVKIEKKRKVFYYAAAAVTIGVLLSTLFYKTNSLEKDVEKILIEVIVNETIEPGTDKAILTLDDGSVVELGKASYYDMHNAKSDGEQIVYDNVEPNHADIKYNDLTIPRGGQFYIKLSDGTQVWLNSESKLRYPVSFRLGEAREVELVYGEAYFNVSPSSKNKGAKFRVINKSQEIEVLGTEFNIKAYRDEVNIFTTLVEGSVAIKNDDFNQRLIPEQQLRLNTQNHTLDVYKVNVFNEISWKNGIFSFRDKPLKDIMKVISRWYNVEVVFENKELENVTFKGVLGKQQNLQEILSAIKTLSIIENYEINEKKIILK